MKIYELLEQTIGPVPPGQSGPLPPTSPTEGPPNTSNSPKITSPAVSTIPPSAGQQLDPTTLGNQTTQGLVPGQPNTANPNTSQAGKPMGQNPTQQNQQQSKDTMTDLDKIAAQIVGLKQKQQQMQQQMQTQDQQQLTP